MIKSILLTGSGGFIGKNLKQYLKNKYKLLTPRSYELDLTNKKVLKRKRYVFEKNNVKLKKIS